MLGYIKFHNCGKVIYYAFYNEKEFKQYTKVLKSYHIVYYYRFYNDKDLFYKELEELLNANKKR